MLSRAGTPCQCRLSSPHAWFYIDVKDEMGKVTNWGLEHGESERPHDVVTIEAIRAKNGSNSANARVVILKSTGRRLFAASSQGQ